MFSRFRGAGKTGINGERQRFRQPQRQDHLFLLRCLLHPFRPLIPMAARVWIAGSSDRWTARHRMHRQRKLATPLRRTPWLARPRVRTHFFRGGSRCIQRRPARTAIRGGPFRHKRSFLLSPPVVPVRNATPASKFLSRSGSTQFFVHRIEAADEFGIFSYRMGSSNQVALHLVARFRR